MHDARKPKSIFRRSVGEVFPFHLVRARTDSPEGERRALEAMSSLIESIDVTLDAEASISRMLERVSSLLDLDRSSVLLETGAGEHSMRLLAAQGRGERTVAAAGEHPTLGPRYRAALRARREYGQEDLRTVRDPDPTERRLLEAGIHSTLCVPLSLGNTCLGTLNLGSSRPGHFDPERRILALRLAPVFALALRHAQARREEDRRMRFLNEIQETVGALSGVTETERLADGLAERLLDPFHVDRAAVVLPEGEGRARVVAAFARDAGPFAPPADAVGLDAAPALARALRSRKEVALERDEIAGGLGPLDLFAGSNAVAILPFGADTGVRGALLLGRTSPGSITEPGDAGLVRSTLRQISLLFENARSFEELRRSIRNFFTLLDTSREISATLDVAAVPRLVAKRAKELCMADECTLFVMEPDGRYLRPIVVIGQYEDEFMKVRVPIGEGITGWVAKTRVGEIVNHAEHDPRGKHVPGTPIEPEAILAVPMVFGDAIRGVMTLYKLEGRIFDALDLHVIDIFATQAAIALQNAELFRSVEEEKSRLGAMIRDMDEAVLFSDATNRVRVTNASARRVFALPEAAEAPELLTLFPEAARPRLEEAVARLRGGAAKNSTQELAIEGRTYLVSLSAVRAESGGLLGTAALLKDVSDRKQIEAQLFLSSKMSAVGQLASGIAHEFNNLIAAIYGYAQFMRDTRDEAVLRKGIDVILTSSQRARELTANLLTFARVRARRHERTDLNEVVSASLALVEKPLQQANIRVLRHAAAVPRTQMDPAGIQQVLLNLILNAEHAMPDGGTLTLRTGVQDGSVSVEVEDTGTGIPAENLDRIFEPFFTTKGALGGARTPGTGLGLTTAYNIVKEHEGTLTVRSEAGKGSAFLVTLPVRLGVETETAEVEVRPHAAPAEGAPAKTVLVVDDDPAIRALLDEVLRRAGYRVLGAADGESAIRTLGIARVSAILLDRRMPGLSGEETYRRIRASHPDLPLVFVSGADEVLLDPHASLDPLVRGVRKPFANESLLASLGEVLTRAAAAKTPAPGASDRDAGAAGAAAPPRDASR